MSYGFYVYTDRESIATTRVYSQTAGKTYEYDYGTGQHSLIGFTDGDYLRFTAVPSDGYEFSRWIYHVGSTTAPSQYSYDNPFTYYGSTGEDIFIAAEGVFSGSGGGSSTSGWTVPYINTVNPVPSNYSFSAPVSASTMRIFEITFANSGTATFYSEYSGDTLAYLSDSPKYDSTNGIPTQTILAYNDDGATTNFSFTYNVIAGVTYYLFVRYWSQRDSGTIKVCIDPPASSSVVAKWDWNASNGSATAEQTIAAHYAVENNGDTRNFSYKVWNDIVDKVYDIRRAKGLGWDITYASLANTKMQSSAITLSAVMFNSLRNNLEDIRYNFLGLSKIPDTTYHDDAPSGKIPHPVVSGKKVFGHYFTTLTTYINSCIDAL